MPKQKHSFGVGRWNAGAGVLLLMLTGLVGPQAADHNLGNLSKTQAGSDESLVERVERVVKQGEAAEAGQRTQLSPRQLTEELAKASADLDVYLKSRPDDVRALILFARLGRMQEVAKPQVFGKGAGQPPATPDKDEPAQFHGALDRALVLEPKNGEAHYWKARLYGVRTAVEVEGRFYMVPRDLDRAIQFARRAVQLAPENVVYREALALYLLAAEQRKEAMAVMREVAGGKHPIYLLASDLDSLPVPDSSVFLAANSENFARMQLERGRISDYENLRVKMYAVPLRSADVEGFYRNRWPSFQLFEPDKAQAQGGPSSFVQFLRWRNGVLEPSATMTDAAPAISGVPRDGVVLVVSEFRNMTAENRANLAGQKLPANFGDIFCFVIIGNFRNVDPRSAAIFPQTSVAHVEDCTEWRYRDDRFGAVNNCKDSSSIQFMLTKDQRVIEREVKPGEFFDTRLTRNQVEGSHWLFTACPVGYVPSVPFSLKYQDELQGSRYNCSRK